MRTTIEYNSKLALGDEIVFYLDGEKFIGKVSDGKGYWINCSVGNYNHAEHAETVAKIFAHFGISNRYDFRNRVIGHDWEGPNGIWPYTGSLEDLKKMLDEL